MPAADHLPPALRPLAELAFDLSWAWRADVRAHWPEVAFRGRREAERRLQGEVRLGAIDPAAVGVQAYADNPATVVTAALAPGSEAGWWRAAADLPADRAPADFTWRVIPYHADAPWPAVLPLIAWER